MLARQAACALATIGALGGLWLAVNQLSSSRAVKVVEPPGAVAVQGGYRYIVQPGETLWSIASALEPGADPRPLVARLSAEIGGRTLDAGQVLLLP